MKFKLLKGNQLYDKMAAVFIRIKEANEAAEVLVKEVGADGFCKRIWVSGGTIRALYFKEAPSKQFFRKLDKSGNWYFPKSIKANAETLKKMAVLPYVESEEVAQIINYQEQYYQTESGLCNSLIPALICNDDYILIATHENATYTPPSELIEITESEFKRLKEHPVTPHFKF